MHLIFITGGARSGKSRFACQLAEKCAGETAYIATAEPKDEEMQRRIEEHRRKRPPEWKLIEEPLDMQNAVREAGDSTCVILDCLTLLVTNWLLYKEGDLALDVSAVSEQRTERIGSMILNMLGTFREEQGQLSQTVIIVSNEVGAGLVPEKQLGRVFRDICGEVNEMVAEQADEVYLMVSGIPVKIKG